MDLYLGDYNYAPVKVIDNYESFVWTERYSAYGDFTLVTQLDYYLQNLRQAEYILSSETSTVMMVETVERTKDETTGAPLVKVTGRDFCAFLDNRSSKSGTSALAKVNESFTGTMSDIIRYIVFKYVADPTLAGTNAIPGFSVVNAVSPQGGSVTLNVARDTVYNMIKAMCDGMGYGFKINRNVSAPGTLTCFIYAGIDRSDPNASYYKVYSPDDDTFFDTHSVESIANYKNHARVLGAKTGIDVYTPGIGVTPTGIARRTLVVDASDVGPDNTTTAAQDQAVLSRRGLEALANQQNAYMYVVDGKTPQNNWNATYFGLGDIVWVKDDVGVKTKSRITEQIWSADASGPQFSPSFTAV